MTKEKQLINDGYVPQKVEKGYQPQVPVTQPTGDPEPQGGYVPTSTGDNPTNDTPPGNE